MSQQIHTYLLDIFILEIVNLIKTPPKPITIIPFVIHSKISLVAHHYGKEKERQTASLPKDSRFTVSRVPSIASGQK